MKRLLSTPLGICILAFAVYALFWSREEEKPKVSSFEGGTALKGRGSSGSW